MLHSRRLLSAMAQEPTGSSRDPSSKLLHVYVLPFLQLLGYCQKDCTHEFLQKLFPSIWVPRSSQVIAQQESYQLYYRNLWETPNFIRSCPITYIQSIIVHSQAELKLYVKLAHSALQNKTGCQTPLYRAASPFFLELKLSYVCHVNQSKFISLISSIYMGFYIYHNDSWNLNWHK